VVPNFVIQAGDPNTKDPAKKGLWGTGGPGYCIDCETQGNQRKHEPKVLSMAGRPAYLYAASGWIYDGSPRCINHLFKINLSEGDSPVPERGEQAE